MQECDTWAVQGYTQQQTAMLSRHGSVAVAQIAMIAARLRECSQNVQFVERIYGGKQVMFALARSLIHL